MVSPSGSRPGTALTLFLTTAAQAGASWALFIFPPVAVEVAAALGVDPVWVGYQVGLMFLTSTAATLYSGAVIERIGAARSIQLALALGVAGAALCATAAIPGIAAGSVLFGLSHSLFNPATALILREVAGPRNRGLVFSVKQTSIPIGLMVASLVGPRLAEAGDWRLVLLPLAAFLLALLAAVAPLRSFDAGREARAGEKGGGVLLLPARSLAATLGNRSLTLMALAGLSFGVCQGAVMTFTSNLVADEMGHPLRDAGYVLMAAMAGGIVGRLGWGHLADRIRDPVLALRMLAASIIVTTAAVSALPQTSPLSAWAALYFAVGASAVGWNGLVISEYAALSRGKGTERQMAGAFFIMFCGGAFCPVLFPWVYLAIGSYADTIGLFGAVFGIAALALLRRPPELPERHRPGTPLEPEA